MAEPQLHETAETEVPDKPTEASEQDGGPAAVDVDESHLGRAGDPAEGKREA